MTALGHAAAVLISRAGADEEDDENQPLTQLHPDSRATPTSATHRALECHVGAAERLCRIRFVGTAAFPPQRPAPHVARRCGLPEAPPGRARLLACPPRSGGDRKVVLERGRDHHLGRDAILILQFCLPTACSGLLRTRRRCVAAELEPTLDMTICLFL